MNLETRLRRHMEDIDHVPVPAGRGAKAAMEKGGKMKRRTQIAGAVAGLGTVAVIWLAASSFPELSQELTPVSTPLEDLPRRPVAAVASDITWTSGEGTLGGFGLKVGVWAEEGAFYVLSTAPGLREIPFGQPPPLAVYRSTDGLQWSSSPLTGIGEDLWAREISHGDSLLYVLGTAPSAADPRGVGIRVGVSADEGATWQAQDLALEVTPPEQALGGVSEVVHLAAGPGGALAAASTSFFVDYSALVPPEVLTPSAFVQRTPEGLAVYDYSQMESFMESLERACSSGNQRACSQLAGDIVWEPNLRWSGTWEELGEEPPPDAFISLFHAPTGGPFTKVETPFDTGYSLADFAVGADGYYAVVRSDRERFEGGAGVKLWRSDDGLDWAEAGQVPEVDRVVAMGALGDQTVLVGVLDNPAQVVVASTGNGTEWEVLDLAGLLPAAAQGGGQWVNAAGIGPAGVIMNVTTWVRAGAEAEREINQMVETADLENWSSTPMAAVVNGYVDQMMVGDELLFINATTGGEGGRVHTIGTRSG